LSLRRRRLRPWPGIVLLLLGPAAASAAGRGAFDAGSASLSSDNLEFRSTDNVVVASGSAVLVSSGTRMEADVIRIDTSSHVARAMGRVFIEDGDTLLLSDEAVFFWEASTGSLKSGYLLDPPWRLWGRSLNRVGADRYTARRAAVTNCDLDPPHYHFRGRRAWFRSQKRATVAGGALTFEDLPVLYMPVWTRSLKDRRWSLRVDPGRDSRNGVFAKSIFGYPFTENTYGRVYWDHFQKTGNGWGAEYDYFRPDVKGSLYGYRIEDRLSKTKRWNARVGHWQQLQPRLSLQANAIFQSDSDFNNRYFRSDYERVRQSAESDVALTYQHALYSARASAEQDQVFDATRNRFVRQRTVLPNLGVQSSPLQWGKSGFYSTLSGSFNNEYSRPQDSPPSPANAFRPDQDLFRQTATSSFDLSKRLAVTKSITLKPSAGVSEEWQAWRPSGSAIDRKDVFQGRVFSGVNLRQRVSRSLDYDLGYNYRVRWTPNTAKRDRGGGIDRGIEEDGLSAFLSYRPGRLLWMRANSGYDLRTVEGVPIKSVREKISPPTVEMSVTPARDVSFFYRQTELLFPVRKPQATQFSVQLGQRDHTQFFSGWSYNVGTPGAVQLRHGASFNLSKGWWLDGGFSYNATGPGRLNYDSVQIIEKYLIVKRDLHCWTVRVEMRDLLNTDEIFFRVDLKTDVEARRRMTSPDEEQFYPARERESAVPQ
jgi:hypothetical protein